MKNLILTCLLAVTIIFICYCGKNTGESSGKDESYPQKLVKVLTRGEKLALDMKIKAIKRSLDMYYSQVGEYPETLDMLVPDFLGNQTDLLDPWDTPFEIETDEEDNILLISAGKDQKFGNDDDIKRRI